MPEKFNELLLKQDIIELYNSGITPDYGYLMNGRFEKDMIKTLYPLNTLSGNPITWEASDMEYLFPVVSLEPKQAGSGDPSPENVRPISGYDSVKVNVSGKNLLNYAGEVVIPQNLYALLITDSELGYAIKQLPRDIQLVMSANWSYYTEHQTWKSIILYEKGLTRLRTFKDGSPNTIPKNYNINEIFIYGGSGKTQDCIVSNIQFEAGSTPSAYEPYQGTTSTLTLPETIYGGTVDAVTGVGEKTWGYIASYNGEALPGEWISDRDVYSAGTTPTTGAQVAYQLAAPEPFQATGNQPLTSLVGYNTMYTNGDSITLNRKARRLEV